MTVVTESTIVRSQSNLLLAVCGVRDSYKWPAFGFKCAMCNLKMRNKTLTATEKLRVK
jgi:hypothetical protein